MDTQARDHPLSIPTLFDRVRQALVKQALEPEWEAKFEPNSYGFRPGRSTHDAIGAIYIAINRQPKYVLDADISKCFDRIDRDALLAKLGTFPCLKRLIKRWLEAGIIDEGGYSATDRGTQQGSVLSPSIGEYRLIGPGNPRTQPLATVSQGSGNGRQGLLAASGDRLRR